MTSPATHGKLSTLLKRHAYFGLQSSQVSATQCRNRKTPFWHVVIHTERASRAFQGGVPLQTACSGPATPFFVFLLPGHAVPVQHCTSGLWRGPPARAAAGRRHPEPRCTRQRRGVCSTQVQVGVSVFGLLCLLGAPAAGGVLQTRTPPCGQAPGCGCFRCFTVSACLRDSRHVESIQRSSRGKYSQQGCAGRQAPTAGSHCWCMPGSLLNPDTVVGSLPQQPDPACHPLKSTRVNSRMTLSCCCCCLQWCSGPHEAAGHPTCGDQCRSGSQRIGYRV